jgi:hypothetical protein
MKTKKSPCKIRVIDPELVRVLQRDLFDDFQSLMQYVREPNAFLIDGQIGTLTAMRQMGETVGFSAFVDGRSIISVSVDRVERAEKPEKAYLPEPPKPPVSPVEIAEATGEEAETNSLPPTPPAPVQIPTQDIVEGPPPPTIVGPTAKPAYNPDESKVAWKGFESTTGQDVLDEQAGELNNTPVAVGRITAKHEVAKKPGAFRYYVVEATPEFAGYEGMGEGLAVVPVDSPLPKFPSTSDIAKATPYPLLPLQGTSPVDGDGSEDQFFSRNHEERLSIAEEKLGLTRKEAEAFYRNGQRRMREVKTKARKAPVRVSVKSVTPGSTRKDFRPSTELKSVTFNKVVKTGEVYFIATSNEDGTERRLVMKTIFEVVPEATMRRLFSEILAGKSKMEAKEFMAAMFPFKKVQGRVSFDPKENRFYFGTQPILTESMFIDALNLYPYPKIHDKLTKQGDRVSIYTGNKPYYGTGADFIKEFTYYSERWNINGSPTDMLANRVIYLDLTDQDEVTGTDQVPANTNRASKAAQMQRHGFMGSYERDLTSDSEESIQRRLFVPGLYSDEFRYTTAFKRLMEGQPFNSGPSFEAFLVGGQMFFDQKDVESYLAGLPVEMADRLRADIRNDFEAIPKRGVPKAEYARLRLEAANRVAAKMEADILFGPRTFGYSPLFGEFFGKSVRVAANGGANGTIGAQHVLELMKASGMVDKTQGYDQVPNAVSLSVKGETLELKVDKDNPDSSSIDIDNLYSVTILTKEPENRNKEMIANIEELPPAVAKTFITSNEMEEALGTVLAGSLSYRYPLEVFTPDQFPDILEAARGTKFEAKMAVTEDSQNAIIEGRNHLTVRQQSKFVKPGIFFIGKFAYEVQYQGDLTMEEIGPRLGITLNEFLKRLTGDPNATTESITDPGVAEFIDGNGKRSVYTFRALGDAPKTVIQDNSISCKL